MYKVGLYGTTLFNRWNPAENEAQVKALQQSGFTFVTLALLHVDADGLYLNNTPIVKDGMFTNFDYLPDLLAKLKSGGSVQKVLFTIGGAGQGDFQNIKELLASDGGKTRLIQNFAALATALPIDGFDFDDEESPLDPPSIATLGRILNSPNKIGLMVTYCPYQLQPQWNEALQQTFELDQEIGIPQSVQWWNLQTYSSTPLQGWIEGLPKNAGIPDPSTFIIPGVSAPNQSPAAVRTMFLGWRNLGINGGFVWNSGNLPPNTSWSEYAQAIIEGLEGPIW